MKRIAAVVLGCLIILVGCQSKEPGLCDAIISRIDALCIQSENCAFSISEVTNFLWDKAVIFNMGSSRAEINKTLGVVFKKSTDSTYGIVFAYCGRIVHQELFLYHPEKPAKLWIQIGNETDAVTCKLITPKNSQVAGSKEEVDGRAYYSIMTFPLGQDDYVVQNKDHAIALDEEFGKIESELSPLLLSESYVGETSNGNYNFKTYQHSYVDFDLHVSNTNYNLKNRDFDTYTVTQITLKNGNYKTPKGIGIGSTKDEVVAAYGMGTENPKGALVYTNGDRNLDITVNDEGFVTEVSMGVCFD